METRKESLSALKVCRFCLAHNDSLSSLYEKSKAPKNSATLSTKIMSCVAIEIFPSDKMPQYICNRCKFFMDLSYGFKQICRQADLNILHFIQNGTSIETPSWPSLLNKVFKAHTKAEFDVVKTVTQDGATVKVTAEEISDSEEGDDENVYSVKIGEDGSEELKSIKVITSVDNQNTVKDNRRGFGNMTKLAKHLRSHAGERAYPCKHCDKSFLKSHHYTRHLRVKHKETIRAPSGSYTEADAYRCAECEETFPTQDELIYHSALHATRSLTCPLCQEKFNDVDTVTAHIKSHVNGAEYMCDFCELIFTTQEKLDTHISVSHDNELNDKDTTENEDDDYSMDAEPYEEHHSINLKEENGQMIVEIKKAGDYMLADTVSMDEEENNVIDQSEGSELEITLNDASGPLLSAKPTRFEEPPKPAPPANTVGFVKSNPGSPIIIKKAQEVKRKTVLQQSSAVSSNTDKKEKPIVKVESTTAVAGASDLSLRLLEKELQDLQRTNPRNDAAKTPAKPADALKNKRSQIHTSTPKPRPVEKKEVPPTLKSIPEKPSQEKKTPGRPLKDKEIKQNAVKDEKEAKEKVNLTVKDDKETKEVKEKETPKVIKNGGSDVSPAEEPVRRSTRPSKVKDYAKMIRDSPDEDEESSEEEQETEETKEVEKSTETPRRGRKPLPKPAIAATPSDATPRKRGRPRKKTPVVPPKISKKESDGEEETIPQAKTPIQEESKPVEEPTPKEPGTTTPIVTTTTASPSADPASNVIVSPSGQTLKKVPIKALPPGVKPMPLPRQITSGDVCEMQIGKKVVKVQKIVMTKAELEAMTKQGLVEMKDGTVILKQRIKLPPGGGGVAASLKSQLAVEEQKKESPKIAKPTRCDLGDD